MNPYDQCLYTIRSKILLDEVAKNRKSFAFSINMPWTGAKTAFERAKQVGKDYIALFSDAARTDKIYHLGVVASIEVGKTTRIEFSRIIKIKNDIWKSDLVKISGGNISKNFIRAYCLCKTPAFGLLPQMKEKTKRLDFNNKDKAKIYKLDHAICSFTGRSLWILDYGADYDYEIDWVDHIIPASKGGLNSIENGALSGWYPNYLAGKTEKKYYVCRRGKILPNAALENKEKRKIKDRIIRFSKIKESDWYLNRALWHISIAALYDWEIKNGFYRKRNKEYWMNTSQKYINKWRISDLDGFSGLVERGLTPLNPNEDQSLMLDLIEAKNQKYYKITSNKLICLFQNKLEEERDYDDEV